MIELSELRSSTSRQTTVYLNIPDSCFLPSRFKDKLAWRLDLHISKASSLHIKICHWQAGVTKVGPKQTMKLCFLLAVRNGTELLLARLSIKLLPLAWVALSPSFLFLIPLLPGGREIKQAALAFTAVFEELHFGGTNLTSC